MKSMGQLMKEMGFNESASMESKKAFIKHLIQADPKSSLKAPVISVEDRIKKQLSFEDYLNEPGQEEQLKVVS